MSATDRPATRTNHAPDEPAGDPAAYDVAVRGALAAAARGWHVFPLVPGEKRPAITRWEDRATVDPQRIERCWSTRTYLGPYGVAVACGPSGLLVVDLDTPKAGTVLPERWQRPGVVDGADVLAVLADEHRQSVPLDTYTVRTPSGGTHLYYAAPALDPNAPPGRRPLGNTAGTLCPLVDTRGHGGYVVAPPTVLPAVSPAGSPGWDGPRRRAYVADYPGATVAPLPTWLVDLLRPEPLPPQQPVIVRLSSPRPGKSQRDDRAAAYLRAAVDRTLSAVLDAAPGTRNRALYIAAVSLGQLVAGGELDEATTTAALIAAGTAAGQTERAATNTVRSGLRAGAGRPRTLTTPSTTNTTGAAA